MSKETSGVKLVGPARTNNRLKIKSFEKMKYLDMDISKHDCVAVRASHGGRAIEYVCVVEDIFHTFDDPAPKLRVRWCECIAFMPQVYQFDPRDFFENEALEEIPQDPLCVNRVIFRAAVYRENIQGVPGRDKVRDYIVRRRTEPRLPLPRPHFYHLIPRDLCAEVGIDPDTLRKVRKRGKSKAKSSSLATSAPKEKAVTSPRLTPRASGSSTGSRKRPRKASSPATAGAASTPRAGSVTKGGPAKTLPAKADAAAKGARGTEAHPPTPAGGAPSGRKAAASGRAVSQSPVRSTRKGSAKGKAKAPKPASQKAPGLAGEPAGSSSAEELKALVIRSVPSSATSVQASSGVAPGLVSAESVSATVARPGKETREHASAPTEGTSPKSIASATEQTDATPRRHQSAATQGTHAKDCITVLVQVPASGVVSGAFVDGVFVEDMD